MVIKADASKKPLQNLALETVSEKDKFEKYKLDISIFNSSCEFSV